VDDFVRITSGHLQSPMQTGYKPWRISACLIGMWKMTSLVVPESVGFASSTLFSLEAGRWVVPECFLSEFVAANGGKTVDP